jgi:two-component system, LuxR family, sensor kinase FixL
MWINHSTFHQRPGAIGHPIEKKPECLYLSAFRHREARLMLPAEEKILQTIYDTSPEAIIVIDEIGAMQSYNRMAVNMFGYAVEEVRGKNVKMLMPPYFADRHDGFIERYLKTGEKRIIGIGRIVTGLRKNGTTFPMELAVGEALIGERRVFTGFIRDLTENQQVEQRVQELQAELIHASRLASLGEISSMIAHETNQPLSAAGTYLDVARELLASPKAEDRERGVKTLDQVQAQIRRAGDTVRRIREFAQKKTPELTLEDINRLIEEANGIAAIGSKSKSILTTFDLSSDLAPMMVDRIQIQQVIMNLVRNSIDAMADHPRRQLTLRSRVNGNGEPEVSVIDSGPGVPEKAAGKLFTPFMTTKSGGTGLGLAICRSIVEAHGGRLWMEPNPKGGAIFRFTLPIGGKAR